MKTLHTYLITNNNTDLALFKSIIKDYSFIKPVYETNIEKIVEAAGTQKFDLLILDQALLYDNIKKVEKLIDLLYPDAATLTLDFTNEAFIRFKLISMKAKWEEAQEEGTRNFIDNPDL